MLKKPQITKNKEILKYLQLIGQLGFLAIISLLIFFFIFLYLDRLFNTGGLLLLPGIILGIISGFLVAYRHLKKFLKY